MGLKHSRRYSSHSPDPTIHHYSFHKIWHRVEYMHHRSPLLRSHMCTHFVCIHDQWLPYKLLFHDIQCHKTQYTHYIGLDQLPFDIGNRHKDHKDRGLDQRKTYLVHT